MKPSDGMNFTSEQQEIFKFVQTGTGNGIIDAVAGAGKTTTIMECARYVSGNGSRILFCAFNKSISKEIGEKLSKQGLGHVAVKTIHALGYQILEANELMNRQMVDESKYDKLIKEKEVQHLLKPFYEKILIINGLQPDLAEDDKYEAFAIKKLVFQINRRLLNINQKIRATLAKETLSDFRELVIHFGIFNETEIKKTFFNEELEEYFNATLALLREGNDLAKKALIMDFTDMIYLPYQWNLESPIKFDFLFIDECQDLSRSQLAVVAKFGHQHSRVLAVGDPRQSIYGFTGADIKSFENVNKMISALQFPLTSCFRCPQKVIELAKNIRSDIVGIKKEDGSVLEITTDKIFELAKPGDLIISRLRAPLLILVFGFIDKNIKVQIHEDEVRDIINEIKGIFKHDELHAKIANLAGGFEMMKSGVTERSGWVINREAERIVNSLERAMYIEKQREFVKQKLEFLHRKFEQWKSTCSTLSDIIKRIQEFVSSTTDSIHLSTIHRAKGLENDRVFILDYDELPLQHLEQKDWEKVQELNLKYVAVTRTKQELFLVRAPRIEVLKEKSLFDVLPFD